MMDFHANPISQNAILQSYLKMDFSEMKRLDGILAGGNRVQQEVEKFGEQRRLFE